MSRRGDEHVGWIEGAKLGRLRGPAERRERPQSAREPSVKHVRVTFPAVPVGRDRADVRLVRAAVPDGNPVTPPELPGDAPWPNVLHPVEVHARPSRRMELDAPTRHGLDRGRGELVHAHEPLQRDQRLDPLARALRERHVVRVLLRVGDQAELAQLGDNRIACLRHGQPDEPLRRRVGDPAVLADHADPFEPVPIPDLEVIRVVARRDLQRTGAEVGPDVLVGDDLQPPPDQRQDRVLADQPTVAIVVRMDRDRGVREHRLGAHGRDRDRARARAERVVDVVERVDDRLVLDLEVRHRRPTARIPVDHVPVAIDVALLVQGDEYAQDGVRVRRVEGEPLVLVIARRPQAHELGDDLTAVLLPPLPDAALERLAPELLTGETLVPQRVLDLLLGRDPGVVGPEDPL